MSPTTQTRRVQLYKRFERFWHWSQALLVLGLLVTGFSVHGTLELLSFASAVEAHGVLAWSLLGLWAFAIFWHLTTGEWRNYVPTSSRLGAVATYYLRGIFRGQPHPYRRTPTRKLNPLQRLAYLQLKLIIIPGLALSGLLYLYSSRWEGTWLDRTLGLSGVASLHTAAAFLMLAFLVVHVYLTTTGHTVFAHTKAMITGWDDLPAGDLDDEGDAARR